MIIRTPRKQRQRSSPPPPRVDVEAMREPSMRIAVYIDMDTVGACHSLREISLRNVDIHAVAAHASPHQRAASVVTPTSTRTAALDQIFLMVGVFAGSRGGCCCGLLAAPHIIVVTRDHERGSTLKALFLYDAATRRLGATYSHASSEAEALACLRDATTRRGWLATLCCAGVYTAGLCGHCLSFLASDAARRVRARRRTGSPAPLESPGPCTEDAQPLIAV